MSIRLRSSLRQQMLHQVNTALGTDARLQVYSGTQPPHPGASLGPARLLADLPLATPPFRLSPGKLELVPMPPADVLVAGTATWASFTTAAGSRIVDLAVGTDLHFPTPQLAVGTDLAVASFALTFAL